jgi:hypothetical protein
VSSDTLDVGAVRIGLALPPDKIPVKREAVLGAKRAAGPAIVRKTRAIAAELPTLQAPDARDIIGSLRNYSERFLAARSQPQRLIALAYVGCHERNDRHEMCLSLETVLT